MKFLSLEWKGEMYHFWAERDGDRLWIHWKGTTWLYHPPLASQPDEDLKNVILSPMPGRIVKLPFQPGDRIKKGDVLLVLSAMKMEYSFKAEAEGQIEKVFCKAGDQAVEDQVLIKLKYNPSVKKPT